MVQEFKDFAEYLITHYPRAKKIVEVGTGKNLAVFEELKKSLNAEILATDIKPSKDFIIQDDITGAKGEIYTGADIIYSIRPPPELLPSLISIARRVNAALFIRPLTTDTVPAGFKLRNYKRAVIYFADFSY